MIDKLVGLASVSSSLVNYSLLQRFLTGIVSVVILTVIGTIMTSLFLAGAFIFLYFLLVHNGLDAMAAMAVVGGLVFVLAAAAALAAVLRLRALRAVPYYIFDKDIRALTHIHDLVGGFVEGFLSRPQKK